MGSSLTLFQKLQNVNKDFYEVIAEILADETVPVEVKAQIGTLLQSTFANMKQLLLLVRGYYE